MALWDTWADTPRTLAQLRGLYQRDHVYDLGLPRDQAEDDAVERIYLVTGSATHAIDLGDDGWERTDHNTGAGEDRLDLAARLTGEEVVRFSECVEEVGGQVTLAGVPDREDVGLAVDADADEKVEYITTGAGTTGTPDVTPDGEKGPDDIDLDV